MNEPVQSRSEAYSVLRANFGFASPEPWIEYALRHKFRRVRTTPVPHCPDCGKDSGDTLGQYVFFSSLLRLKRCRSCELVWSDGCIDQNVINEFFERTYKDEQYFAESRAPIFDQLAALVDKNAPEGASVIDIGGGMGHLMHAVKERRPDIHAVVNDVSEASIAYARETLGLEVMGGAISELDCSRQFDVAVLSDVLYYERDLPQAWNVINALVKPSGCVILRGPNKLHMIRLSQFLRSVLRKRGALDDSVPYFNPEHRYILSRGYLVGRLKSLGFARVRVLPSPTLRPHSKTARAIADLAYGVAAIVNTLTRAVVSPAMVVVAKR